jgi:hypothetical protein
MHKVFFFFLALVASMGVIACNESSSNSNNPSFCDEYGLVSDSKTLFFEDFEDSITQKTLVDGVCGNAISLVPGESDTLNYALDTSLSEGTIEFWFRPGKDFYKDTRTLLGNDGSRVHFVYSDSILYFQKNITNHHIFVSDTIVLDSDWNHIAGQWGNGFVSLFVNGTLVAQKAVSNNEDSYQPASTNNTILIGTKSSCCMEGINIEKKLSTSGDFDQVRISNIERY